MSTLRRTTGPFAMAAVAALTLSSCAMFGGSSEGSSSAGASDKPSASASAKPSADASASEEGSEDSTDSGLELPTDFPTLPTGIPTDLLDNMVGGEFTGEVDGQSLDGTGALVSCTETDTSVALQAVLTGGQGFMTAGAVVDPSGAVSLVSVAENGQPKVSYATGTGGSATATVSDKTYTISGEAPANGTGDAVPFTLTFTCS